MRGERGCLPDRCRAPQGGSTPLHFAAEYGHAAVVGLLLAAKADVAAKNAVIGGGDADREGSRGNTHLFLSSFLGFFREVFRDCLTLTTRCARLCRQLPRRTLVKENGTFLSVKENCKPPSLEYPVMLVPSDVASAFASFRPALVSFSRWHQPEQGRALSRVVLSVRSKECKLEHAARRETMIPRCISLQPHINLQWCRGSLPPSHSLSLSRGLSFSLSLSVSFSFSSSLSLCLSLSLSLSLSRCRPLLHAHTHSLSLCLSLALFLSLCICDQLSLSVYFSFSLSCVLFLSLSLFPFISLFHCHADTHTHSFSRSPSLSLALSRSVAMSRFLSISVALSRSLSISVALSLSFYLSLSISLSPTLSLPPSLSPRLSNVHRLVMRSLSLSHRLSPPATVSLYMSLPLSLPLSLSPSLPLPLSRYCEVWCRGGRRCGRGRPHLRGERGRLPDHCCAPQNGDTPLHEAAFDSRTHTHRLSPPAALYLSLSLSLSFSLSLSPSLAW